MKLHELSEIIQDIHNAFSKQAGRSVNMALTLRNWLIGFYIKEYEQNGQDRAEYGAYVLKKLSEVLKANKVPATAYTSLKQYRQFYEVYPQIGQAASGQFKVLIQEKVLPSNIGQTVSGQSKMKFVQRPNNISSLSNALLNQLNTFFLEMGRGFCFEASNKKILIGDQFYFVDLVLYHRILKSNFLIELKINELNHEHVSQLNTYVNYYKKNKMHTGDNPPVGLLLCTEKNEALAEYALGGMDNQLFISKYKLELPTKAEIKAFLEKKLKELPHALLSTKHNDL